MRRIITTLCLIVNFALIFAQNNNNRMGGVITYTDGTSEAFRVKDVQSIDFYDEKDIPEFLFRDFGLKVDMPKGLPCISIESLSKAPVIERDTYLEGNIVKLYDEEENALSVSIAKIRGRGNSTWLTKKKPYKLKFNEKCEVFGMSTDKEWALLADYFDGTLIRNAVAFYMSQEFGNSSFSPHAVHANLIINNKYVGTYLVSETIKAGKNRVNIGDNGYLLEIDNKGETDEPFFHSKDIGRVIIKEPEELTDDTREYIKNLYTTVTNKLYSANFTDEKDGYRSVLDVESFVEWYLINDISKNNDACFFTSCFMHLPKDGKLRMGPIWDFDLCFGNVTYNNNDNPEGFWIKKHGWYKRLFKDPYFEEMVHNRYLEFYSHKEEILDYIDRESSLIKEHVIADMKLWGIKNRKGDVERDLVGSKTDEELGQIYQDQITELKLWISRRMDWLHENM